MKDFDRYSRHLEKVNFNYKSNNLIIIENYLFTKCKQTH